MPDRTISNRFYYVYVLESMRDGKQYIGFTTDLRRHMEEHQRCAAYMTHRPSGRPAPVAGSQNQIRSIFARDFAKYSIADLRSRKISRVSRIETLPTVKRMALRSNLPLEMSSANCLSFVMKIATRFLLHHWRISASVASAEIVSRTELHSKLRRTSPICRGKLLSMRTSFLSDIKRCRHVHNIRGVFERRDNFIFREFGECANDCLNTIPRRYIAENICNTYARTFNTRRAKSHIVTYHDHVAHGHTVLQDSRPSNFRSHPRRIFASSRIASGLRRFHMPRICRRAASRAAPSSIERSDEAISAFPTTRSLAAALLIPRKHTTRSSEQKMTSGWCNVNNADIPRLWAERWKK